MMHIDIHSFLSWVSQHPYWAIIAVFVIALTESLAVVGLLVPGAILMVAAGALIGMGVVSFWPILLAAIAGAVVGDGVSFWFGYHYRERVLDVWPFSRHPEWLARSERFFHRHGSKSVLFGRFVGPVRAIIPVVAGMLGMPPAKFYQANILSAFAWAPGYLLPGMAFGASLALAGEVAARLMVLLVLLGGLIWGLLWLIRWLFQMLSPRAGGMTRGLLAWGRRHARANNIISGLLDPSQPELKTLLVLGMILIGATGLFLAMLKAIVSDDPLVRMDQGVHQIMQQLRTPWGDRIMVFVTELGDGIVIALVALTVLVWLLCWRNWRAAGYWVAAVGFGQLVATMFKLILQRPRPFTWLYDGVSTYAFPSGHATMSMVVYGFLAVLIARHFSSAHRWMTYALAAVIVITIALSRLYLGAHWLSDVLGGLSLGLVWVSLLGIAYYRHPTPAPLPRSLPAVALLALVLTGGWHVADQYTSDMQRYAPRLIVRYLDATRWWQDGWRHLPVFRQDLEGELEQPLNVQWSGSLPVLDDRLRAQGWHKPIPLSGTSALHWLLPEPSLSDLPVLPQVHDGRHESLLMLVSPKTIGPAQQLTDGKEQQLVLRLWNSGILLEPGAVPLWIGNVSLQQEEHILLLTLPVTIKEYNTPIELLRQSLNDAHDDVEQRNVVRAHGLEKISFLWNGNVLLIRDK